MKRILISSALAIASSIVLAAQGAPAYNKEGEQVFSGTVKHVVSFAAPDGTVGVHVDLQTADGLVNVHIAPAMYIGMQNFWVDAGDKVEIVGSRVAEDENVAVWVRTIKKGSQTLAVRNDDGTPRWAPPIDGADGCGVNHTALPRGTER